MPSIAYWVEWCYGRPAKLYMEGTTLLSQTGAQQGDPLGPLLFSLAIHPTVVRIQTECPTLQLNNWYLDDGTIMGPPAEVLKALSILQEAMPSIGLHLNLSKCELYSHDLNNLDPVTMASFPPEIKRNTTKSAKLLGVPFGAVAKCKESVEAKADKIAKLIDQLAHLNDPHLEFVLFRACLWIS